MLQQCTDLWQQVGEISKRNAILRNKCTDLQHLANGASCTSSEIHCAPCNGTIEEERIAQIKIATLASDIEEALEDADSDEALANTVSKKWPLEVFKRTPLAQKGITEVTEVRVVVVTQGSEHDAHLMDKLMPNSRPQLGSRQGRGPALQFRHGNC